MERIEFKKHILEEAKRKHQKVIDDFKSAIQAMREDVSSEQEGSFGFDEQGSLREEIVFRINKVADELNFAIAEVEILDRLIIEKLHEEIMLGSVVVTDKRTFFVSASVEIFEVDGKEIVGISLSSPIYEAMKGKKKGENFSYNRVEYYIEDIF